MAALLRRRSTGSSCFQLLQDALSHKPSSFNTPHPTIRSSSGNRLLSTPSRIGELDVRFVIPPRAASTAIWRPAAEWERWMSSSPHSGKGEVETQEKEKRVGSGKLLLYRAKWIRPIRLLVRLKLIQLGGVMALALPLAEYSQQGSLSLGTTLAVVGVVGGAGAASTALWYYSRRLVGEMALLLPDLQIMQISVLDFWGNREDLQYKVSDIIAPLKGMTKEELDRAAQQIVIPLDVLGGRQFFLSLRHGYLVHKDLLFTILNGSIEARDITNLEPRI